MCSSGISIMTKSAAFTASATSFTCRPAFAAFAQDGPPLRRPTVTFMPDSLQVERMRVTLRAVADDRDLLALDQGKIGVFVVIDFH